MPALTLDSFGDNTNTMSFTNVAITALAVSAILPVGLAQNRPFPLYLISNSTAEQFGAKCLDGSAPGYYYKPAASDASQTKWKFHFRGGGWCSDAASCYSRVTQMTGSSLYFPSNPYDNSETAVFGMLDDNATNPFGDWNAVWVHYCDGSSWVSSKTDPVTYTPPNASKPVNLWLRGYNNMEALMYQLEQQAQFLSTATEVIVAGTSAGGMTTALFAPYIKSRLSKANDPFVVGLIDAGWWWDAVSISGFHAFAKNFEGAVNSSFWNATTAGANTLPSSCTAVIADPAEQWKCMLTDVVYNGTMAAIDGAFVMQSLYDPIQLGSLLELPCDPYTTCSAAQLQEMQDYRVTLQDRVQAGQAAFGSRDGHFMTACYQHEETCRDFDWYGIQIADNTTGIRYNANTTFYNWYQQRRGMQPVGSQPTRFADVAWPNDASCEWQLHHGGC